MSVREESLNVEGENMSVDIEMELDIKACKFWIWTIKLARIVLVECSKVCWYLDQVVLKNV